MKVHVSADARDFLREETRYLRRRSPPAADRLLARIVEAKANLARFPELGPGLDASPVPGSRRLVIDDYVLAYEINADGVAITAIRHGRMQPSMPAIEDDSDYEVDPSGD